MSSQSSCRLPQNLNRATYCSVLSANHSRFDERDEEIGRGVDFRNFMTLVLPSAISIISNDPSGLFLYHHQK